MHLKTTAAVVAALAALLLPAAVEAHVTIQPNEGVPAGGFTRLDVRVPSESDDASVTRVSVQFPDGFYSASTEPVPGWTARVQREKLPQPAEVEGERITEQVSRVTFRAQDGGIGPGQFQDFGLSVKMPDKPGTLTFKATQTYVDGETSRWIGPPGSDEPAPQIKTVAEDAAGGEHAAAEDTAAATPTAAASKEEDDDDAKTLAVIALIAAGGALLASLIGLVGRRRRA